MLHTNQWGWRGAARRLWLAPLAAGVALGSAAAQTPAARPAAQQIAPRGTDPQELLKQGREALKGGQFDRAQDLAKQADANNSSGRWGLFADTPESLEKDVAAARVKAGKAESEKLTKAAKELYNKPYKTPGDRIANLDEASALADKAMTLAGPSDFFDDLVGPERPEKLKKEIDTARTAVRKANPGVVSAAATSRPAPGGVVQASVKPGDAGRVVAAGFVPPPSLPAAGTSSESDRAAATKLVATGRDYLKAGRMVEAKGCATQAQAMNVPFGPMADSPDALSRDAMSAGNAQIDKLCLDASARAAAREFARADANLAEARKLAVGLGLQTRPIDERVAAVRQLAGEPASAASVAVVVPPRTPPAPTLPMPAPGVAMPSAPAQAPVTVAVAVTMPGAAPVDPSGGPLGAAERTPALALPAPTPPAPALPSVPGMLPPPVTVAVVPPAPAPDGRLTGEQLLAQARVSLRAADLVTARKLTSQAFNSDPASKAAAEELMRVIDAEVSNNTRTEAAAAFKNATASYQAKQYESAAATLHLIDPVSLPADQQAQHATMLRGCEAELAKIKPVVAQVPAAPAPQLPGAAPAAPAPADLTGTARSQADIEFGRLRSKGLDAEAKARDSFQRGETDVAIQMLSDFTNEVKASSLSPARQNQLLATVDRRLENFRVMKRQTDFYKGEATAKNDARTATAGKLLAENQKHDEIKRKTVEIAELVKKKEFRKAEELALQVKAMDPDDPTLNAMYEMAKRQRRVEDYAKIKGDKESTTLSLLNGADSFGTAMTDEQPLKHDPQATFRAKLRGDGSQTYLKPMTDTEREIEVKLNRPLSVHYENVPLTEVIASLRKQSGLNIVTDDTAIADAQLAVGTVFITEELRDLSLRSILTLLLDKARLKFVVENNVVRVTTAKRAQGKLIVKTFSVMELVTPIPDFALAPHQSFANAMKGGSSTPAWSQSGPGAQTFNPTGGLPKGEMISGNMGAGGGTGMAGGSLQSENRNHPMADSATLAKNGRSNHSAQLIRLIQQIVQPYSWSDQGGSGAINYYDIGGALVINQTADVIGEVQQLLESLRRLQEVSVSVEIRVISLSEAFFERIGVDFSMNIKTKNTANFERSLTTGQFRPEPFINDINTRNVTVGYNPTQGGFTPDLDVPIRTNSFGLGVPPFGGYPGPGNGGLGLGLAFLNDIQVYMFMEAASGDRRVNIMQAPKITLFNGQTATVFVSDFAFFTTGLDVINVGGQFVYIPRNTPIPIGNSPAPPGVQSGQALPGVTVTVQAIVSSDRRFVRLNLAPTLTSLTSAVVPLFPVTAFITPVFEGGSQGVPIPFTQFFQQPSISEINVQTTVQCPDGGTVVLGGLKTLAEGRNEFGPPVLSQLPYINRLFRNQGIGRETRHIMIMVTPRIIIQSEEELNQTGGGPAAAQ